MQPQNRTIIWNNDYAINIQGEAPSFDLVYKPTNYMYHLLNPSWLSYIFNLAIVDGGLTWYMSRNSLAWNVYPSGLGESPGGDLHSKPPKPPIHWWLDHGQWPSMDLSWAQFVPAVIHGGFFLVFFGLKYTLDILEILGEIFQN
jgi:hypothetical protein